MRLIRAAFIAAGLTVFAAAAQQSTQTRPPIVPKNSIAGNPFLGPWLDYSGTIAITGTAQALMPADPNRTGFFVQNQSTSTLTLNIPAANGYTTRLQLVPNAYYEAPWISVPTASITISGTAGASFAAAAW